ncbi:MAG: S-layer homology domain-containing protein [Pseudoflavonifractor sp.]
MKQSIRRAVRPLLAFVFPLLLLLCCSSRAAAAEFPDIKGHWAEQSIQTWAQSGLLKGYPDGGFHPDDGITRAQLAEVIYRLWDCPPIEGYPFPDVSPSAWYYASLTTMNAYGVALNTDSRMLPDEPLSREEAFYMIAKAFTWGADEARQPTNKKAFSDFDAVSPIYTGRVSALLEKGFVRGGPDGALHPKDSITRAEVLSVIARISGTCISHPGDYTITVGSSVLVTCPGVRLHYVSEGTPPPYVSSCVYMMNAASQNGVTFSSAVEKPSIQIYGVSVDKPTWKTEGGCKAYMKDPYILSRWSKPNLNFSAGDGSKFSPYIITTAEQLQAARNHVSSWGVRYFKLVNDLTLSGSHQTYGPVESLKSTSPTGRQSTSLYLDGGGHTITYQMKSDAYDLDYAGLFYSWRGGCSNLTLAGSIDLTFTDRAVAQASVNTGLMVGGFAAEFHGQMVNCTSTLDMNISYPGSSKVDGMIGGLVGGTTSCSMTDCLASGRISAQWVPGNGSLNIGGLLGTFTPTGWSLSGRLTGCGSTANLSVLGGEHSSVGGLVGCAGIAPSERITPDNYGYLKRCWSTAVISSRGATFQSDCGGLIGQFQACTVSECWAKPTITVPDGTYRNVGGIAGAVYSTGSLYHCWANAAGCDSGAGVHYGGIAGRMAGTLLSHCFVLGTEGMDAQNAISYATWTEGPVPASMDMTAATGEELAAFYERYDWDFETIWDSSGNYPLLRNCDTTAQRGAQS